MATLVISELDDDLDQRLRQSAATSGTSPEDKAKAILRASLDSPAKDSGRRLLDAIQAEFGVLGSVDIDIPPRQHERQPPRFDEA